jgi:hypothetical protein
MQTCMKTGIINSALNSLLIRISNIDRDARGTVDFFFHLMVYSNVKFRNQYFYYYEGDKLQENVF